MKTRFGIHAIVLSDINLTGKSSIRFRFCAVLNGQNPSVEEADQNSCCLWVDWGGKVVQKCPDSSDACISIETLLSAHLGGGDVKKKSVEGQEVKRWRQGMVTMATVQGQVFTNPLTFYQIVHNVNFSVVLTEAVHQGRKM